jgi:hypothetical protein
MTAAVNLSGEADKQCVEAVPPNFQESTGQGGTGQAGADPLCVWSDE